MERNLASAVAIAKFAALLAFSVLCITAAYSISTVDKHVSATLMHLNDELDEMHRLTLEAGLTAMEARKASAKEISYLDQWNKQISGTITDFHTVMLQTRETLAAIQGTSEAATQTVVALQAPITQTTVTLLAAQRATEELQPVIAHVDALVSDPHIAGTIAQTDATMSHLDATAADVQQEVHSLTHPTWLHKIWGGILDVAHVFNPL